jgi:hypothetical protein
MSLHRRNPKRDANEPAIVDALEAIGVDGASAVPSWSAGSPVLASTGRVSTRGSENRNGDTDGGAAADGVFLATVLYRAQ